MINNNKYSRSRKGFTLVELLAVIVILAIILIIAVPKIMSVIEDSKKATLESTAKMIASSAEKTKIQNAILGKDDAITCDSVAQINKADYASCSIEFEDDTAKVTIQGSSKFEGLYVCGGDKTSATAQKEKCSYICESNEVSIVEPGYKIVDYNKCVSYLEPIIIDDWGAEEKFLQDVCKNEVIESRSFHEYISILIDGYYTKEELISNNVVSSDTDWENNIKVGNYNSCVNYTKITYVDQWGRPESELQKLCSGEDVILFRGIDVIKDLVNGYISEQELIENKVIKIIQEKKCLLAVTEACFDFDSETGTILGYYEHQNNNLYEPTCPKDVVIPNKINEVNVKKIGDCAFTKYALGIYDNCSLYTTGIGITSVIMPNTITEIGNFAFYTNDLVNVKFSNSIEMIGKSAFQNNQITGELDLSGMTSLKSIEEAAFYSNQISGVLDLSNTKVETIGRSAFNANQLTSVKLPVSINTIESSAFGNNLTTIINPSGKSFDWYNITYQGTTDTCTFATGTCGNITIKAS